MLPIVSALAEMLAEASLRVHASGRAIDFAKQRTAGLAAGSDRCREELQRRHASDRRWRQLSDRPTR